jgi:uncharacterized spore protein YtfJ
MANISTPSQKTQGNKRLDPNRGLNTIQTTMDKFLSAANVEAVYGTPISQGENIVIPAAEVLSIAGFGLGAGGSSRGSDDSEDAGSGSGGGGGGRVLARPVAAIVISPRGVRIEPIVDVTKIGLAVLTTLGFMVGMLTRMNRTRQPKLDG